MSNDEQQGTDLLINNPPDATPKDPDAEVEYLTLVGRVQPADRRAEGAGFATHIHCSIESIRDGKQIHLDDAQEPIINREEAVSMPLKIHPDADEIAITITSVREDDDMDTLEMARFQRISIEDLRRGPMPMSMYHASRAVTIPPPTTLLVDDLCDPDGNSRIVVPGPRIPDRPARPIYRIDEAVATPRGVGRIVAFKESGTTVPGAGFIEGSDDTRPHGEEGPIVVVKVADDMVDFYANDIQPYHMTGAGD